jgi:hypothetical protein
MSFWGEVKKTLDFLYVTKNLGIMGITGVCYRLLNGIVTLILTAQPPIEVFYVLRGLSPS